MILLASVPPKYIIFGWLWLNFNYFVQDVDDFFVHGYVQSCKSALKLL